MVGSVQGAAQQPFSVLYKPGSTSSGQDNSTKDVRQNDRQQARTEESGESRDVQKAESKNESSSTETARYAAYDRDDSGAVRASGGDDQRRGSVVNITV